MTAIDLVWLLMHDCRASYILIVRLSKVFIFKMRTIPHYACIYDIYINIQAERKWSKHYSNLKGKKMSGIIVTLL